MTMMMMKSISGIGWQKKKRKKREDEGWRKCKCYDRKGCVPNKCWMLDKNKFKCPECLIVRSIQKEKEMSCQVQLQAGKANQTLGDGNEFSKGLLDNPSVWIADTEATRDLSPHIQGAKNP
jgi:hypothetical protein